MPEQRVVVERDLRVQCKQLVVLGRDERIDLHQRRVCIHESLVETLQKCDGRIDLRRLQPQRERQLARLPCAEPHRRIDGLFEDGLRRLCRDLLNLHAAGLRSHKDELASRAIEHDAEIELAINGRRLLDQQPLHLLPLRARSGA